MHRTSVPILSYITSRLLMMFPLCLFVICENNVTSSRLRIGKVRIFLWCIVWKVVIQTCTLFSASGLTLLTRYHQTLLFESCFEILNHASRKILLTKFVGGRTRERKEPWTHRVETKTFPRKTCLLSIPGPTVLDLHTIYVDNRCLGSRTVGSSHPKLIQTRRLLLSRKLRY
ncbi:hypothetical protein HanIR_Chr02g0053951 [Helianthus annuus]|nr:hypothetical protein HanIR_Chr02g0053951 [Helianthus annuus]